MVNGTKQRCVRIDCNLVEVLYLSDSSREWIYRGSMRLEPLYRQHHGPAVKSDKQATPNRIARAHTGVRTSHIEYIDLTRDTSPTDENRTRNFHTKDKKQDKFQSSVPQTDKSVVEEKRSNTKNKEGGWEAPWIRSRDERQK
uniref:Histone methyltransferase Tudor domain-containing protein n=1 Tax=Ciona savignyi TaxID=51511 RepID=H2YWK6_CIOSA